MAAARYAVDMGWGLILQGVGVAPADVLRQAQLSLDLFQREGASVSGAEYFRLWDAIASISGDPLCPLKLVERASPEAFSPPLFASLCSRTLDAALDRLARYKPLIGPMHLSIEKTSTETTVRIAGLPDDAPPPPSLIAAELVFFTQLARLGLRRRVAPARVGTPVPLPAPHVYADWFGCAPHAAEAAHVAFHQLDAEQPFLTANPAMWAAFEPSLRQRLSDAATEPDMSDRVRRWLNEVMASGRTGIEDAARALGLSTRTLQRRLAAEGTSFQAQLSLQREALARHYLTRTRLSTAEIAFLLGYSEQNSFYRAFHDWTGSSPDKARRDAIAG